MVTQQEGQVVTEAVQLTEFVASIDVCITYIMSNRYVYVIKPEDERFMM